MKQDKRYLFYYGGADTNVGVAEAPKVSLELSRSCVLILGVLIRKKWALTLFTLVLSALSLSASQPKEFRNWPAGTSPTDVGKRVAERFVSTVKLDQEAAIYPAMCTWYGALSFAQLTT